jgi:hypothetical protein
MSNAQNAKNSKYEGRVKAFMRLCDKVQGEYDEWRVKTLKRSKKQVYESAAAIVLFDNIVYVVKHKLGHLSSDDLQTLMSFDNTLLELQDLWLVRKSPLIDDLTELINVFVSIHRKRITEEAAA